MAFHHETVNEIERLRQQYQFFHWHLEFPDVFLLPEENQEAENQHTGWNGGFDVMLSNPPWERVKLQEKEWFASRDPEIANAPNAASRKRKSKPLKLMILHSFMHLKSSSRIGRNQSLPEKYFPLSFVWKRRHQPLHRFCRIEPSSAQFIRADRLCPSDRHRHRRHHKVLLPGLDGLKVTEKSL